MNEFEFREHIVNDINKSCFIEAGAGAGKTTLIVNRVINQIKSNVNPSEIVIITYTNAAAEELRSRISEKIKDLGEVILSNFSKMKISTIHSFCLSILEEYCFEAKIPLGFSLLVEDEEEKMIRKIFDDWSNDTTNNLDFKEANKYIEVDYLKDNVYKLYKSFINVGEETLLADIPEIDINKIINQIKKEVDNFLYQYNSKIIPLTKGFELESFANKKMINFITVIDELDIYFANSENIDHKEVIKIISNGIKIITGENYFKAGSRCKCTALNNDDKVKKDLTNLMDKILDSAKKMVSTLKYRKLLDFAYNAYQYYLKNRPNDIVTNNSILSITKKLLDNSESTRLKLVNKYKCIYVDEYQDTNQIQDYIIFKLSCDKNNNIIPGKTFIVGDPKQSIYRFTGADVEVFIKRGEFFKSLFNKDPDNFIYCRLNSNFRSNKDILDYINDNFIDRFNFINYDSMEVAKGHDIKVNDENLISGFYQYNVEEKKYDINKDGLELSKLIKYLINNKKIIEYKFDEIKKENYIDKIRPVQYKDIMVITDDTTKFNEYLKCFKDNNIPVSLNGKYAPDYNFVINAFIRLYKCLVDFDNDLSLYSAIELLKLTKVPLYKDATSNIDINNYYKNILYSIKTEVKDNSGYGIAKYLSNHIEFLLPRNIDITNIELRSIKKKLNQIVETVISKNNCSALELSDYFEEYASSDVKFELNLSKENDAIRFMNFHKCKGLESNIVIFAKRFTNRNFDFDTYRNNNEIYPSLSGINGSNISYCSYYFDEKVIEASKSSTLEEEKRFEYVILTRAKQAFIFMPLKNKDTKSLFNLEPEKENHYDLNLKDISCGKKDELKPIDINKLKKISYRVETNKDIAKLKLPTMIIKNPSMEENIIDSELLYKSFNKNIDNRTKHSIGRPVDNIVGTILHRSFELLINNNFKDIDNIIDKAIIENCNEERILSNKAFFKCCLESFLNSDLIKLLNKDNSKNYTEFSFSYFLNNEYHNGSIDLLIENDDGTYLILDYKSDNKDELSLDDNKKYIECKYKPQVSLYKDAISKCFNVNKDKINIKIIYFRNYDFKNNNIEINSILID